MIPPRGNRGTPRDFGSDLYQARHLIENVFGELRRSRAIATRYDETARGVLAGVHLAAAAMWLK